MVAATTRAPKVLKRFWSDTFAPPGSGFASGLRGPEVTAEEILAGGVRESDWSFPVLISTPSEDRQGDVVVSEGCDYEAFAASPIFFFDHQEIKFPVGLLRGPDGRFYFLIIPGKGILGRVWIRQPKPDDPEAYVEACKTVWILVRDGLLNGISAGFDPLGEVKALRSGGSLYKRWELLEVSGVSVAANRECRVLRDPFAFAYDDAVLKRFSPSVIKGLRSMSTASATVSVSKHIRKEGDEYVLYDHAGKKVLGRHKTREEAVKQEAAVKASEARSKSYGVRYRRGEWVITSKGAKGARSVVSKHKTRAEFTAAMRVLHAKSMSENDGASGGYAVPEGQSEQTKGLRATCKAITERMKDHDADGHSLHFNPKTGELHHSYPDSANEETIKGIHADISDVPGVKSVIGEPESGPKGEGFHKFYPHEKDMDGGDSGGDGGDMMTEGHSGGVEKRARRLARVGKAAFRMVQKRKLDGWIGKALEWTARRAMPTLLKAEMDEEKAIAVAWGIACVKKGLLPLVVKAADDDPDDDGDDDTTTDPAANPDAAEDATQDTPDATQNGTEDTAEDLADNAATDAAMDAAMDVPEEEVTGGPDGLELVQTAIENLEAALPRLEPERRAFWSGIIDQIREHGEDTYPDEDFGGADTTGEEGAVEGANDDATEQKVSDEMLARYKGLRPRRIKRVSIARKLKSLSHRDPATADIIRKAANHLHEIGDMPMEHGEKGCTLKGYTPAHHRQARIRARELDRLHGAITKAEEKPREEERPAENHEGHEHAIYDQEAFGRELKGLHEDMLTTKDHLTSAVFRATGKRRL